MSSTPAAAAFALILCPLLAASASAQTRWVDWMTADAPGVGLETAEGVLAGSVDVTFTGDLDPGAQVAGGQSFWAAQAPTYTSALVSDPPPPADILRISGGTGATVYTISFSQPVLDPVLAILSLGSPSTGAILDFDRPFVIENSGPGQFGNGPLTSLPGDVLSGAEGNGVIRFPGEHSTITFTAPAFEYWYGFTVGVVGSLGQQRCSPAVPNSTGRSGALTAAGSRVAAANDLVLAASLLPANTFGLLLCSRTPGNVPNPGGSQGTLCLGGAIGRYNQQIQNSGPSGNFVVALDLSRTPQPSRFVAITAGETWFFQCWHRDVVGGMQTSNLTDAVSISFQ